MTSDDDVRYLNATPEEEATDRAHWERRRIELARMFGVPVEKMTIGHAMWFDRPSITGERSTHKWPTLASFDILASTRPASSGIRYAMAKDVLATSETKGGHFVDVHAEGAAPLEEATGRSLRGFLDSVRYVLAYTGPMTPFFAAPYSIGARVSLDDAETHNVTGRVVYLCAEELDEEDGVLAIDARFARHLESIGDNGKALAAKWRKDAESRWAKKHDTASLLDPWSIALQTADIVLPTEGEQPPPVMSGTIVPPASVKTLARAIWRDVVGPRLAKERRKPASLVRPVHVAATLYHSRGPRYDEKTSSLTFEGRRVAELTGGAYDIEVIQRGLGLLGSVVSHELFHWQVMTGHQQYLAGSSLPHIIEVDGGTEAICSKIGVNPKKHAANVRALLAAQAAAVFTFPDGSRGNMLVLNEMPARGRRRAHTRIELGSMLMPGYVHESLAKLAQRDRKLVPMLRERVPLHGRANEHGEQRTMSLTMMATLRDKATELVTEGGALITDDDFLRLADRSGLPRRLIIPVREVWLTGDDRAVPFLKRTGRDRYTLADPHELERDFIEEGGRQELQGSVAGEKGAAKKRSKLARLGRK